jgi:outer membrane lipopolysaccharide assembly protein LptE/RlpB
MDHQILDLLSKLKIAAGPIRDWFTTVFQARTGSQREQARQRLSELQRQLNQVKGQKDQLIRLRVSGEIEAAAFTSMKTELQAREAGLVVQVQAAEQQRGEEANLVGRVIDLLQTIQSKWLDADIPEKRRTLDMLCCGFRLQDKKLVPTFRKPFDVLVGGPPSELAQAG